MKSENRDWRTATNILCIRLDAMGDVLMTTPAMRALKENQPQRKITLLTSHAGAEIARYIPEVDKIIIFEAAWMKAAPQRSDSRREVQMIERLALLKFDGAVIFTVFSQNPLPAAMLAYLANIPLRLAHCRENPYQLLTNWLPEIDHFGQADIRHEVRRQLDLVAAIGCRTQNEHLSLAIPPKSLERMRKLLIGIGLLKDRPWLVMHPGATASSRRYAPQKYAAVAQKLATDYGFQIVFTGGRSEVELIEGIRAEMSAASLSLTGNLNIQDFSALISLTPLLISNNTGPVHIAAALGTPVVDLYALTNPQHTPWQVPNRTLNYDVPCKFCYKSVCPMEHQACLNLVSPEDVVEATSALFAETHELGKKRLSALWSRPLEKLFAKVSL